MNKFLAALAGTTAFLATNAMAQDAGPVMDQKDWFVKLGTSYVMPDSANLSGGPTITAGNALTVSAEVGYFLTDRISVSLAGGLPPTHDVIIAGSKLGTVTLGAVALDAQFHLVNDGPLDLYVGGGLAFNIYFNDNVPGLNTVSNGLAPVLQAGVEYKVSDTWGVFVDAKKEFFTTTLNGAIKERLDPFVVTAGVSLHF